MSLPVDDGDATVGPARGHGAVELLDAVLHMATQEDRAGLHQALVDRARSLTGADSAALHLLDPERAETRVAAVAGAITALSTSVGVPVGESPPGAIFLTGMPASASSDRAHGTLEETWAADPIISAERIVASTGVPLRAGTEVLAALSIAWRRPHRIDPDEIDVLHRLAAHAVPLIRAHERAETAAEDAATLRAAFDRVSRQYAELQRFHEADEQLLEVAMDDVTLDGLAQAVVAFFGGCVAVVDLDTRQLAAAGRHASMPDAPLLDEAVAYAREHTLPHVDGAVALVPVRAADELQAVLIVIASRSLDPTEIRILSRVSAVATVLITHDVYVNSAGELARMEFFNDVFDIGVDDQHLPRRAASLGLDVRGPMCVACVSSPRSRKQLAETVHTAARSLGGMAAAYRGTVVAIFPGEDPEQGARELHGAVAGGVDHPALVAAAGPVGTVGEWGSAQREALRCLQAMTSLDRQDGAATMGSLGFMGLVLGPGNDPQRFIDATIGALLAYDARRSSALEHTLLTFLDCGSSSVAAAEPLHVHVNTVKQRLERVGDLLGPDWRAPQRLLEIHLALRLRRLLST
ncbi:helix-turn-helix domain-containing protein [Actinomycetospora flava]|uniref:Helix-turn-helix domain-containing protein n=1 Tax=Actinomycetospora flava TaxID=3129232 RepID=A0ABU8M4A1_9PSEU